MSTTTPSQYTELSTGDYGTTQNAFASEWKDLIHNNHYRWSIKISKLDGHAFPTAWDQADFGFETAPDTSGPRDLETIDTYQRLRREDNVDQLFLHVEALIEHLELRATVVRLNDDDTTTQIAQQSVTDTDGTPTWQAIDFTLTDGDVSNAGDDSLDKVPIRIDFDAQVDADGNTGKLYQLDAWEAIAEARATIPSSADDRYKGLTATQQNRLLVAVREDTLVTGGGGYPARQSEIGVPADATVTKIWTDATDSRCFFNANADTPEYTTDTNGASGLRFDESANEHLRHVDAGNIDNDSLSVFEHLNTASFTVAIRVHSVSLAAGEQDELFGTGFSDGDDVGFEVAIEKDSNGDAYVNADLSDGSGTNVWACKPATSTSVALSSSGYDDLVIEQDTSGATNTVSVSWNGTEVFRDSGFSVMADGTLPDGPVFIGYDGISNHADAVIQGFAVDTEPGHGDALIDWIKGQNYRP